MTLIEAIARMEGWGVPEAHPTRDNNPGDICAGEFSRAAGAAGADGRFAVFPSPDAGFKALRDLLTRHYVGMTLQAAIAKYAPACENDTARYVANVCAWTGLEPSTILTTENIG